MDEQRILEEMERMLAADDPRLAAQLASFGRPGLSQVLRTRRARSLITLAIFATIAILIYAMLAFRIGGVTHGPRPVSHTQSASAAPSARAGGSVPPRMARGPGAAIRP
jgi:Protein of unknown function (DUF3040)